MGKKLIDFGLENERLNKGLNDVWKVRANKDMQDMKLFIIAGYIAIPVITPIIFKFLL